MDDHSTNRAPDPVDRPGASGYRLAPAVRSLHNYAPDWRLIAEALGDPARPIKDAAELWRNPLDPSRR